MADTPLHEHPAVVHLMGTEHWPKIVGGGGTWILKGGQPWCSVVPNGWRWEPQQPEHPETPTDYVPLPIVESLITLAAVRGMCNNGDVHSINFGPCNDPAKGEFYAIVYDAWGRVSHYYAPTEPLAILAAYQATVMEQGAPDAKPE